MNLCTFISYKTSLSCLSTTIPYCLRLSMVIPWTIIIWRFKLNTRHNTIWHIGHWVSPLWMCKCADNEHCCRKLLPQRWHTWGLLVDQSAGCGWRASLSSNSLLLPTPSTTSQSIAIGKETILSILWCYFFTTLPMIKLCTSLVFIKYLFSLPKDSVLQMKNWQKFCFAAGIWSEQIFCQFFNIFIMSSKS